MSTRDLVKLIVHAEKILDTGAEKKEYVLEKMADTGLDAVDLSVLIDDIVQLLSSKEGQRLFMHSTNSCKRMCFK